ncbi:hypothetical protein STEG23_023831 [Scotinomys teguina]
MMDTTEEKGVYSKKVEAVFAQTHSFIVPKVLMHTPVKDAALVFTDGPSYGKADYLISRIDFRASVQYDHEEEHASMQADVVLELRVPARGRSKIIIRVALVLILELGFVLRFGLDQGLIFGDYDIFRLVPSPAAHGLQVTLLPPHLTPGDSTKPQCGPRFLPLPVDPLHDPPLLSTPSPPCQPSIPRNPIYLDSQRPHLEGIQVRDSACGEHGLKDRFINPSLQLSANTLTCGQQGRLLLRWRQSVPDSVHCKAQSSGYPTTGGHQLP